MLLVVCVAAFALILTLLSRAIYPRRRRVLAERHRTAVLVGGLAIPSTSLIGLLLYATVIGRRIIADPETSPLRIEVTGHQWWWEVHYPADGVHPALTTANELHLPIGVPVEVEVLSGDVIHSFWIPSLAGKRDMIPGRMQRLGLRAARAGRVRGQCAEYCGAQHAQMAFGVVAQAPAEFDAWRQARAAGAAPPSGETARRGLEAFVDNGCADCHRVAGILPGSGAGDPATGLRGPDLTHVAARPTIAARTLPYNRDNIALWIRENDRLKPGNRMPVFVDLPDETVAAIAAFVDTLQ